MLTEAQRLTAGRVSDNVSAWLSAGARAVWVIDPRRETIARHGPGRALRLLSRGDVLDGDDVVPGFRRPVADVFFR